MTSEAQDNPSVFSAARSPAESSSAVWVHELGKCYRMYRRPEDRLKQALFRGRRRYYQEFWALRNVSLSVRRGETFGVMGRNGSGKSTLLQLVSRTLQPTEGRIETQGRVAALLELGSGFHPEFTGRDNVYTNAAILGLKPEEIAARYSEIVAFADLGDFIDRPVQTYSSGMLVRLAFAVASSIEPEVLIVDEALAVGDEAFQRKCFARIEAIKKRSGTILFVSHSAGIVQELCDRAALLDHGELLMVGEPRTVVNRYHKLLYCPADQTTAVREAIKREGREGRDAEPGTVVFPAASPPPPDASARAWFDPGMTSKSTVIYAKCGAEILDPHISTLSGRRVNVLIPHQEYLIQYRIRFAKPASQVMWGTLIKTIRGVELSGMAVPMAGREYVAAGSEVCLTFRFRCLLMPGTYFANVGVHGIVDGKEGFLHRMVDALMFRVLPDEMHATCGVVDCFAGSEIAVKETRAGEAA